MKRDKKKCERERTERREGERDGVCFVCVYVVRVRIQRYERGTKRKCVWRGGKKIKKMLKKNIKKKIEGSQ